MMNSRQHEMFKWLAEILHPVVNFYSTHTLQDTFHFCQDLDEFVEAHSDMRNTFMCSFDVTSLFTNVPLDEVLSICLDTLYRKELVPKPSVPETLLKKMLEKATKDVEFSFDNKLYQQVDGVAMGSPLGPVLANIFVGYCEKLIEER